MNPEEPLPPVAAAASAGSLLLDVARELQPRAQARGLTAEASVEPAAQELRVESWAARRILMSLTENVLRSRNATTLRLSARADGDQAEFRLESDGDAGPLDWESDFISELAVAVGATLETDAAGDLQVWRVRMPSY